ncbi:LPS-assembly protein LptD [Salinisphaera hydrothermalis]|uniref:LPS-assembly protein LptD n=1 Tax=Salinisphaera hydrothermalis TaxID=563188 RepID=UPI00333E9D8B
MIHFKLHSATRAGVLGWALSGALIYTPAALAAAGSNTQGCPVAPPPLSLPANGDASTLVADQASLANDIATAQGHVHLERNGQTLEAPYIRYNRKTSEASAHGGLKYLRDGLYLTADKGNVNVDRRTGEFDGTHYSVLDSGARGKAARVDSLGDNQYRLRDADYSTCPGPTKAWLLSARRIDLNRQTGRGVAHDATLKIYGVPLLYTPYINFPIDNQRHTGFLTPTIGASSKSGFELAAPYYINLAPNYDATLVPRVMAKRGFQLGGQFRYLTQHQKGEFDAQVLPYDTHYGAERDLEHFEHIGQLTPHVGIQANYTRVSDVNYFDDLSNDLAHTSTSQLDRSFELTAVQPGVKFSVLAQDFQTLNNYFNGLGGRFDNEPYRRLPQATLNLLTPTAPFQAGLDAQFTNFQRSDSVNAYRTDVRPRLIWGTDHGSWFANSEAAYRITHYDLRDLKYAGNDLYVQPDHNSINREIPSFRADAGLRFSRTLENGWIQTLEPRMQYLFVGYQNQSDIPIFDSGSATLNYDQLFSSNRYTGIDRIGDANQVTLGVSSRFVSPNTGRTVGKLDFGRVTSFRNLRVDLPNSGVTGYDHHGSDYVAGGMFSPSDLFTTRATLGYDAHRARLDRAVATATIGHRDSYQLDLGYRYYRDYRPARRITRLPDNSHGNRRYETTLIPGQFETLSQVAIGLRAPIGSRLNVIARWNYSLKRNQNIETLAGLEYRPSCCYAARVAWRHYVGNQNGRQDNAIMFQFVLRGLGRFGNSVSSFVQKDVFSTTPQARSTDTFDTIRSP